MTAASRAASGLSTASCIDASQCLRSLATYDGTATLRANAGAAATKETRMNADREEGDVDRQPADADWIPRLLRELALQYSEVGAKGQSVGNGLQPLATWMRALSDPGGLVAAQQAMLGMACTHLWAVQSDWADAWWRFMAGEALMNVAPQRLGHHGIVPWLPTSFIRPIPSA